VSGSKWFNGRRVGGVLAALVVMFSLSAAKANASSPTALHDRAFAATESLPCADELSKTVAGVTIEMRPCLTTVTYGGSGSGAGTWLQTAANLTFTTDPNEPVDLCRLTFHRKVESNPTAEGQVLDCMEMIDTGTGNPSALGMTLLDPDSPISPYTCWATVEIVSVDGPVQAVSFRFTFDGPF